MKKLLVYLHGKGADKNLHENLIKKIAEKNNADIFSFNAPLNHKSGYKWFVKRLDINSGKKNVEEKSFNEASEFIISQIEAKLSNINRQWGDVIICGHSQGGCLAINVATLCNAKKAISICGDIDYNFDYSNPIFNKNTPIYWIEGAKDEFLSDKRKQSYKILLEAGYNLKYIVNSKSGHNSDLDISIADDTI